MDDHQFSGRGWRVVLRAEVIQVDLSSVSLTHDRLSNTKLSVRRKWFRHVLFRGSEGLGALPGCKKVDALALSAWLRYWELLPDLSDAVIWKLEADTLLANRLHQRRWISMEDVDLIKSHSPASDLLDESRSRGCEDLLSAEQLEAAKFVATELESRVEVINEEIVQKELVERRAFFESVEQSSLSEEQVRAVVCFDNRVQVLAAAGSGKTSVMVARAAYAVDRGLVPPDRVLLLAFNRAAASELQERIESRFAAAGISSEGVKASTIHAFGLEVIGRATGKKPRLAAWLEQEDDLAMIIEIVDHLRDSSEDFRYNWDLYRLLFANTSVRLDGDSPDGYDSVTHATGFRTFSGILVKSQGERLIADFLFLNGVGFEMNVPSLTTSPTLRTPSIVPTFTTPTSTYGMSTGLLIETGIHQKSSLATRRVCSGNETCIHGSGRS